MINKLLGFFELKEINLPTVSWKEYTSGTELDSDTLWTIRSAVYFGDDLNLPRAVGVTANEAMEFANKLIEKMGDRGIVVYYPYFKASKSGTLKIGNDNIVVEAVKNDLWNLVTYSERDLTIISSGYDTEYFGRRDFLPLQEQEQIFSYVAEIRRLFRDEFLEGKELLLEWSFAQECDLKKEPVGEEYLIFYELRTI